MVSAMQNTNTQRGGTDLQNAADLANKLLAQDSKSYDGHRILGQIALIKKDPATALKELHAANEAKPLEPEVIVPYVQALGATNRFPEAETLAYKMIEKDKTYATIYDILYSEYARLNRLDDAERVLKLKSSNNPKNASYMLQLATFYIQTKRRDQADAIFKSMTDEKEHPDGHLLAGDFFFFACGILNAPAMSMRPRSRPSRRTSCNIRNGWWNWMPLPATTPALISFWLGVLKDNPKDSEAIAMRAALMLTTGNRDQINMAANDLQSLVTKSPDNYVLRYNLARALHAKSEDDQAILQLEKAIQLRPDFMKARDFRGRALHGARRKFQSAEGGRRHHRTEYQ